MSDLRRAARDRKRRQRERESNGEGVIPVRWNLAEAGELLRGAGFLPADADDERATLGRGFENFLIKLRDSRDVTASLCWRQGEGWTIRIAEDE